MRNNEFNFHAIPKFCINLKRSTDRRERSQEQFDAHGLNVMFIEAIDKRDLTLPELSVKIETEHGNIDNCKGIMACALSHVKVIKLAKEMKLPVICIFEDDVIFCDDFNERIKYLESLQEFDFDFFSLGGHYIKPELKAFIPNEDCAQNTKWPYVYRTKKQGGTYAYIITEKCYDFVIRNINYNFGMDEFYSKMYERFNSLAFVPFLAGCRLTRSDITDVEWNYENIAWYYTQQQITGLNPKPETKDGKE